MLELIVLLLIIFVFLLIIIIFDKLISSDELEHFNNYLQSCPTGFKPFYNSNGDTICCNGETIANKCNGSQQCILNNTGTKDIPSCIQFLSKYYSEKGKGVCPPSMPQYFEDKSKNSRGCTSGSLNSTMTGPKSSNQPICQIYSDLNSNIISADSCANLKNADDSECFGSDCSKRLIQPNKNGPPLVAIEFGDDMGIRHIAYTRNSLTNYLNNVYPNWKEKGMDLSRNISVAEVAKAVYIDKTMSPSSIQY